MAAADRRRPRRAGQGEHGGLEGGRGDGVEVATQRQEAALAGNELPAVALGGAHLLGEDRGGVSGVAGMAAVVAEAPNRVFARQLQEGALVEGAGAGRHGETGRISRAATPEASPERGTSTGAAPSVAAQGARGPGQEREVGEADVPRSRAATLAGNRPSCAPDATAVAAACPVMWQ